MALLNVTPVDKQVYKEQLEGFLPEKFIDCHTHVWLGEHIKFKDTAHRSCAWPNMVAKDNSVEDLVETYRLMFPNNKVIPCLFSHANIEVDLSKTNEYVRQKGAEFGFPTLYLAHPSESAQQVEERVLKGGYKGLKVYLEFAPSYIPTAEIRCFDFLTHEHLEVCNRHGWAVMLHIPRSGRLKDPVNYRQIMEIEEKYPNVKLIIAHLGRAYANEDLGDTLEIMKDSKTTMWDFTANTNAYVMQKVLETFGPDRFMFGSDLPIFRMKAKRVVENGFYINVIPKGSLGDVSGDPHMREVDGEDANNITFFLYEEILSCKKACGALGLGKNEINKIFYENAARTYELN